MPDDLNGFIDADVDRIRLMLEWFESGSRGKDAGDAKRSGAGAPIPTYLAITTEDIPAVTSTTTTLTQLNGAINNSVKIFAVDSLDNIPRDRLSVIQIDSEQMLVTASPSISALNVERGYNGTTPASHADNAQIVSTSYVLGKGAGILSKGSLNVDDDYELLEADAQTIDIYNADQLKVISANTRVELIRDPFSGVYVVVKIIDDTIGPQLRIVDGVRFPDETFDAHLLIIDPITKTRTLSTPVWAIDLKNTGALFGSVDYLCHDLGIGTGGPAYMAIDVTTGDALSDTSKWLPLLSDPAAPLAFVLNIVDAIAIANGAQTVVIDSSPTDFASHIKVAIVDANTSIGAGLVTLTGTDTTGTPITENINIGGGGSTLYTSTLSYKTVTNVDVSGLVGATGIDFLQVWIGTYPQGTLRTFGGSTYLVTNAGGASSHQNPNIDADWSLVVLNNQFGYSATTTYAVGDYVQELRPVEEIQNDEASASTGQIVTDPATNTVPGDDYTFTTGTAGTDFNIDASVISTVSTITFNLPDASPTNRGAMTTTAQVFDGEKDFLQLSQWYTSDPGTDPTTQVSNGQHCFIYYATTFGGAEYLDFLYDSPFTTTFTDNYVSLSAGAGGRAMQIALVPNYLDGGTASDYGFFLLSSGGDPFYAIRNTGGDHIGKTATITLAKITGGGSNGSLTFTGGILTDYVDPT